MLRSLQSAFWCPIALWSAAVGPLLAQAPVAPPSLSAPVDLVRDAPPGLCEFDGSLWATGPRWRARFVDRGYEFVPGFGAKRADQHQVRYTLEAIGRGGDLAPVAPGNWRHEALRVESRYGDVVARYDVVPEGLQQSFVFDRLPAGAGDLVVRGRLATGLEVVAEGAGLRLSSPGGGSMSIGGVTGIDAKGGHVAGEVRYADGVLDLVLPAAFVENAALPLVLDPLVGGVIPLTGGFGVYESDVAYDAGTDRWLVAYGLNDFFNGVYNVYGQLVEGNGGLTGSPFFIALGVQNRIRLRVANVRQRGRFVVVWDEAGDVRARTVSAANGSMSPVLVVAGTADTETECRVAGEATSLDDDALCVWRNATAGTIEGAQIAVAANGSLSVFGRRTLIPSAGGAIVGLDLPRGGGDSGLFPLVYARQLSHASYAVRMQMLDRNLLPLGSEATVGTASTWLQDELSRPLPSVTGAGRWWIVEGPGFDYPVAWNGPRSEWRIGGVGTADKFLASSGSSVIGVSRPGDLAVRAVEPFVCGPCEPASTVPIAGLALDTVAACGKSEGGGAEDEALVVINAQPPPGDGPTTWGLQARLWRSADGLVADLGGGCGEDAGHPYATCARAGNAQFTPRLLSAAPTAPALFVISRDVLGLPCGGCRLQPDPYTGFAIPTATDSAGDALVPIPIPNLPAVVGLSFVTQWVVAEPVTPGCFQFGADLSRAFRITIE